MKLSANVKAKLHNHLKTERLKQKLGDDLKVNPTSPSETIRGSTVDSERKMTSKEQWY